MGLRSKHKSRSQMSGRTTTSAKRKQRGWENWRPPTRKKQKGAKKTSEEKGATGPATNQVRCGLSSPAMLCLVVLSVRCGAAMCCVVLFVLCLVVLPRAAVSCAVFSGALRCPCALHRTGRCCVFLLRALCVVMCSPALFCGGLLGTMWCHLALYHVVVCHIVQCGTVLRCSVLFVV